MKIEDIKVGMEVYAIRKSVCTQSWLEFLHCYPNRITTVKRIINGTPVLIEIGEGIVYNFLADDLTEATFSRSPLRRHIKSKQPITISALLTCANVYAAGFTHKHLACFIEELVKLNPCYVWEKEIPANIAQQIFIKIGLPNWLEDYNFIMKEKEQVIKNITVTEHDTQFVISAELSDGNVWNLFGIFKDGRGFRRAMEIPRDIGIETTTDGEICEK
jgi:hypothetical protein